MNSFIFPDASLFRPCVDSGNTTWRADSNQLEVYLSGDLDGPDAQCLDAGKEALNRCVELRGDAQAHLMEFISLDAEWHLDAIRIERVINDRMKSIVKLEFSNPDDQYGFWVVELSKNGTEFSVSSLSRFQS